MKNKIKNIFKSIGIILLLLCFNSVMFSIFNINLKSLSEKEYLIYTVLFELVLLIIFIIIYRKTLSKNGKEYFKNFSENFKQSFKYWLVGFIVMATSNIIITFVLKQTIAGNEELVRSYIDTSPLLMIFSTVIYAPICEELTFRKSIKDAINNKYIYILTYLHNFNKYGTYFYYYIIKITPFIFVCSSFMNSSASCFVPTTLP